MKPPRPIALNLGHVISGGLFVGRRTPALRQVGLHEGAHPLPEALFVFAETQIHTFGPLNRFSK